MGATKEQLFTDLQTKLASYAKALAHPARIAILQQLAKLERCVCGDLVTDIGLAQATVSQHLKELKKAGLIKGTIEGVRVCYCIDPEAIGLVQNHLNVLFDSFKSCTTDECC
ncbi:MULTISPECIES: helix-turn-helix transcriptional regulator [unclassified Leeuwenhoekiella]|uniref:ArsR/SmtB family transcription factor n=1 Tax=unclassified Leeuwenhoekiella TaxID=2615029 RepID=UPI000C6A6870|nr:MULTISPECIES: metalloregulator ArsR/SmtB family transcription factor [unclassified Leeuwenhoekiella]MAW95229.1 transcriptional regulator [Leeuwenhoekiella sp.]MBA81848.1 transcriptional regulator [Leeuwenhoekiella sp.]|tara:strand:- start:1600 stop:1935 length:336 start_codon:yes stop_codon:yes gene_type:complete